jgi:hypothetical protein
LFLRKSENISHSKKVKQIRSLSATRMNGSNQVVFQAVEDTSPSSKKEERSKGRRSEDGLRGRPKDNLNQSSSSSSSKNPASSTSSSSADIPRYKVSFDYGASNADELSLKKDEIITVSL